jgi:hypothetical protein
VGWVKYFPCFTVEQDTGYLGNVHLLIASGTSNHSQLPQEVVVQAFATIAKFN